MLILKVLATPDSFFLLPQLSGSFPILSLDPASNKDVHFLKYLIYISRNKRKGQIYSDGNKSNNNIYNATCIASKNHMKREREYKITTTDALNGHQVVDIIPSGSKLLVSKGESIKLDQLLTINPNVGRLTNH
ncbi:hypothetical protein J1N35_006266 [Gossypium stocksii]|uniref:Cytochrome f n=1 Tax=Gossypium stocksii TaxID=47602 RepID=A0A9D3WGH3_9ROSI|nr:hypothetical protein J1N35_006266 [Gossypium stocksii]